jgi:DnaJ-class molecular chaperone
MSEEKTKTCPTCHGLGKIITPGVTCEPPQECETCKGTGKVPA